MSHIPRAKSVLAMVAKAGAVQRGAHSERNYLRSLMNRSENYHALRGKDIGTTKGGDEKLVS